MNNFNWTKAIGFGVLLWAIMALSLWVLGNFQSLTPIWTHGIVAGIGAVISYIFATNIRPENGTQAAGYGLMFAGIVVAIDIIVTQWFDAHIFSSWQYWLGPALVFLAPWVQTQSQQTLARTT